MREHDNGRLWGLLSQARRDDFNLTASLWQTARRFLFNETNNTSSDTGTSDD